MNTVIENAWITVVREQGKHLACRIMENSPATYRVATQEPLNAGEMVRLRLGDQRVIAEVRQCARGEGHYSITMERVDDRLGVLNNVALKELFDGVPGGLPQRWRRGTAAMLGFGAVAVVLAISVLVAVSGFADRASAGPPEFVLGPGPGPGVVKAAAPDVPGPPPLEASRLSIRATSNSWVTACADGKKLVERLFQPGDTFAISFSEAAIVRSGNAAGLELTLGDKSLGVMGQPGAVRMLRATPQGYDYVPADVTGACTP